MREIASLDEALTHFEAVIGLEVHAQLKTNAKLFSVAPNRYEPEHPNKNIAPYCLGLPGVLPVLNEAAVRMAIKAGLALDCTIKERSVWSRKQYFYPDLPKGYQISQYDEPICEHGHLQIQTESGPRTIPIERIHMEEDAGKSTHVPGAAYSLVDYNRAGVPLIEIVSGPDMRSAQEASAYLKALRSVLMALQICDGNMEEGSFRCDANVSIRPIGQEKLGTRCELKNINSFRFVEQAIEVEIVRHARLLTKGERIQQETRLFDPNKKQTRSMRSKEEAHDYRYFPDPDLPPLQLRPELIEEIRRELPELPAAKKSRYLDQLKLPEEYAQFFSEEPEVATFFEAAIETYPEGALGIANLIKGQMLRELKESPEAIQSTKLEPKTAAELVRLKDQGKISSSQQKKIFTMIFKDGADLQALLKEEGEQVSDAGVLGPIIDQLVQANPKEVEKYKSGKTNMLKFFVGQVMRATKGKANPQTVTELVTKKLESL